MPPCDRTARLAPDHTSRLKGGTSLKWATVLILAFVVMAFSSGTPASASHIDLLCVDQDDDGVINKEEARAVVAAYFSPAHSIAPEPGPLSDTVSADLWVYLSDEERSDGTVVLASADPAFDIDRFDLAVFVDGTTLLQHQPDLRR